MKDLGAAGTTDGGTERGEGGEEGEGREEVRRAEVGERATARKEGANSSSVRVRNYNGAIHHERPPIRHADPRARAREAFLNIPRGRISVYLG